MELTIRDARPADAAAVSAFTQGTFRWGDYVADAFPQWIRDPASHPMVADHDGDVVAVACLSVLSETEGWFQGARVRPDWRRRGVAGRVAETMVERARSLGLRVVRLMIEEWNAPAVGQVERDGFRDVGDWVMASRTVGAASPLPSGNGGVRVPAEEQLVRAHSADAMPALMSWSSGPLGRAARSLLAVGWAWRQATIDDLVAAATHEALWSARAGWVMAARRDTTVEAGWLECREEDAVDMMRAVIDLAVNLGADDVRLMLPAVDWLKSAARRAGCDLMPLTLFQRPV